MCGIAGWLSPRGRVQDDVLRAMRETIAHRGPDGAGAWTSSDRRVGLAHRRLSIVDLSPAAAQPMHAERDGRRVAIVFNGEVYNHRALRAELELAGARFRTDHSDTEVLLHGYLAWGLEELLRRLRGMFAFCLWDEREARAHLVRDRVGIKPLYVADVSGDLLFASEAKALFAHPGLTARLDPEAFRASLTFRAVPAPRTLFAGVACLGPGERLELDLARGTSVRHTWWDPLDARRAPPASLRAAQDELEALLADAVACRVEADVPVGLFLSGGVDSAYLLQLMRRAPGGPPATFTAGHAGHPDHDEAALAARLAREAGAAHHPVALDGASFAEVLARVAWHQDEPIAAPVCATVYRLAQAARAAGVPVVLAGEGSDELFVGYRSWLRLRDLERWSARLPAPLVRAGAGALGQRLPWHAPGREILRRAAAGQPLFWSGSLDFGEAGLERLLGPALPRAPGGTYETFVAPLRRAFEARADARDATLWMSYVDLRFRLPQLMLPRLDKMGMAFGVEGRVPFLDQRVVELVLGLPPRWRGGAGRRTKALFKAVAERALPASFVRRTKRGFRAPVGAWKEGPLGTRLVPALDTFAARTGLFDRAALRELLALPGSRLWFGLANVMLWYLLYVEDVLDGDLVERPARPRARLAA